MIIPMLCVTIFVILVVWFLLPRVARLMIHTPTAISIFVCLSMVQLMAVFISMRCTLCGHFLQVALTLILEVKTRSEERFSGNAETDLVCRLLLGKTRPASGCAPSRCSRASTRAHCHVVWSDPADPPPHSRARLPPPSPLFPYTTLFRSADCYQYFCVPEYGTANGRLHFHAVHFMRTLPTGSVDPNFGSEDEIGRAVQRECRDRSRMPSSAWKNKTGVRLRTQSVLPRVDARALPCRLV